MKLKINGADLETLTETCPLVDICKQECSDWEKRNYANCPHFAYNIGKPKVVAYIVNKIVSQMHDAPSL